MFNQQNQNQQYPQYPAQQQPVVPSPYAPVQNGHIPFVPQVNPNVYQNPNLNPYVPQPINPYVPQQPANNQNQQYQAQPQAAPQQQQQQQQQPVQPQYNASVVNAGVEHLIKTNPEFAQLVAELGQETGQQFDPHKVANDMAIKKKISRVNEIIHTQNHGNKK